MLLGAITRRPDKATAYEQPKIHLIIMAAFVAVICATPYVLHFLPREKEELRLQL